MSTRPGTPGNGRRCPCAGGKDRVTPDPSAGAEGRLDRRYTRTNASGANRVAASFAHTSVGGAVHVFGEAVTMASAIFLLLALGLALGGGEGIG